MAIRSPLVGVSHVPDQSHTAEKEQQTEGWNSGAVALPAFSTAHSLTISLFAGNGSAKRGRQANTFSFRGRHVSH